MQSIRNHEAGKNHQFNVKRFLFEARAKKVDDTRQQQDLQRTLEGINAAAHAHVQADLAAAAIPPPPPPPPPPRGAKGIYSAAAAAAAAAVGATAATAAAGTTAASAFSLDHDDVDTADGDHDEQTIEESVPAPPPPPPPPPARVSRWDAIRPVAAATAATTAAAAVDDAFAPPPPPPPPPPPTGDGEGAGSGDVGTPEVLGLYSVRGTAYLQAEFHPERLRVGSACEAYLDDSDDWHAARVLGVREMAVPNTAITLRFYSVEVVRADATAAAATAGTPTPVGVEVPATSLRIRYDGSAPPADSAAAAAEDAAAAVPPPVAAVDENTGMGVWQSVAVHDDADAGVYSSAGGGGSRKRARRLADQEDVSKTLSALGASARATALEESLEADRALDSYNPFGGRYKGVDVDGTAGDARTALSEDAGGGHRGDGAAASASYGGGGGDDLAAGDALPPATLAPPFPQIKARMLKPGQQIRKRRQPGDDD